MLKRGKVWLGVLLVCIFAAAPFSFAFGSELKVGVVDLQKALNSSERGKKAKAELMAEFEKKTREIEAKKAGVEALRKELEKKASLLSPKAKKVKEEEYRAKLRDLKHSVDDAKAELTTKENELSSQILKELVKMIRKKGKSEGYALILEANGGVIYAAPSFDITSSVIKAYDAASGLRSLGTSKTGGTGKKK